MKVEARQAARAAWLRWVLLLAVPDAAIALPQPLRVTSVRLTVDTPGGDEEGRMRVGAVVQDEVGSIPVDTALLSNALRIVVSDGRGFEANVPLTRCRRAGNEVMCATRHVRALLKRSGGAQRHRLHVLVTSLAARVTGPGPLRGPVRVSLQQTGSDTRVDVITDCKTVDPLHLSCRDRRRPNIVFIVTDDQRWDTLQYMPRTLDRLAANGVMFTNAFVTTPVCGPSRASLLTGNYVHRHGVLRNIGEQAGAHALVGPDASTLATWLDDAGYRTGMYGKYMVGYASQCPPRRIPCYRPPGWDEWHVFWTQHYYDYTLNENGFDVSYGGGEADYSTDVVTAKSVEFIRSARGQPFFLHIGYHAPHGDVPGGFPISADRHDRIFRGSPPTVPPSVPPWQPVNWDEEDVGDKPRWVNQLPRAAAAIGGGFTRGSYGELSRLLQLEASLAVDEGIEAIVSALEATGQADNTVIVLTADNGYLWGEHRVFAGKDYPYEESIRVPLIIRYPRLVKSARSEPALALNIDIVPTLARLAGVKPPTAVDGVNLVPLLRQKVSAVRNDFLLEWWSPPNATGLASYTGLRTTRWKYVVYPEAGETELYDLLEDPFELVNRARDPEYQDELAALQARLQTLTSGG